LITRSGQKLTADFYIDCSGWRKILSKTVGMKYQQYADHVNNRAVASPQPKISDAKAQVTTTRAQNVGWTWDIPLSYRRGCGYVYASDFISDDEAVEVFCQQFPDTDRSKINFLKFQPEVCTDSIKNNVAVVGLSGGFLEPLEATSLFLTFLMVRQAYKHVSQGKDTEVLNRNLVKVFDYIASFVLSHYVLSKKDSNEYWRYYKNLASKDKLMQTIYERSSQPDTMTWHERNMFFPYSWWALLNGYDRLEKT
jgi:tryptophan 7-halogenase